MYADCFWCVYFRCAKKNWDVFLGFRFKVSGYTMWTLFFFQRAFLKLLPVCVQTQSQPGRKHQLYSRHGSHVQSVRHRVGPGLWSGRVPRAVDGGRDEDHRQPGRLFLERQAGDVLGLHWPIWRWDESKTEDSPVFFCFIFSGFIPEFCLREDETYDNTK